MNRQLTLILLAIVLVVLLLLPGTTTLIINITGEKILWAVGIVTILIALGLAVLAGGSDGDNR